MLTSLTTNPLPSQGQVKGYTQNRIQMESLLHASRLVETLVAAFFNPLELVAGKPMLEASSASTLITVPYYAYDSLKALSLDSINGLGHLLSDQLGRPVQLVLVRLLTPVLDAHVLARYLSLELKHSTYRAIVLSLFSKLNLVTPMTLGLQTGTLIGVKVRLAGRLIGEPSRPRQTIQTASIGTFSANSHHALQSSSYTTTNLKGTYTLKVWLCVRLQGLTLTPPQP